MSDETKILLPESSIPTRWYNIAADLPEPPAPPLHPGTREPAGPADLAPLFPMALIEQEVSTEQYIEIPDAIRDVYKMWRPTPMVRARRLEEVLGTPARIYFKYEGTSPAGSHKPNTAVAQAHYNAEAGVRKLVTETGAGQWGSALAYAGSQFDIQVEVFMVKVSYEQKPYRRSLIETWGATIHPSPSDLTESGRKILADHPDSTGSLGMAISEAVEVAATSEDTNYSLGSVLSHVLLHQTVIGEESLEQLEMAGERAPDVVIGCSGGGSNLGGLILPFLREKLAGRMDPRLVAVEPAASPSFTKGEFRYDFGDSVGMTPLMKMHTLGHDFVPEPIHAGGLRYHGMAPLLSHIHELGMLESTAINQLECFEEAVRFARTEGIVPAPEPTHAIAQVVREALRCKEQGSEEVILFNLSGHGHFDMGAYDAYFKGELEDYEYPEEKVAAAMASVPVVG